MISSDWRCQISEKKNFFGSQNLGPTGPNRAQNEVFLYFLESGESIFLETAYNDSF